MLITGANGWIGRNAIKALKNYHLTLVDYRQGYDPNNRFGLEKIDKILSSRLAQPIYSIDLTSENDKFIELLDQIKPDCVLHLASVLENQNIATIQKNEIIHSNVLETCAKMKIAVIAASSIMVMYGAAMGNEKICKILQKETIKLPPEELLTADTPLNNTQSTIKKFNENGWENNFIYIKTKEKMEALAKNLVAQDPELTIVCVRFGWTGIKNPYTLEGDVKHTETTVYLDEKDLQNFLTKAVKAVLSRKISGYRCYPCISKYSTGWINQEISQKEIGWKPEVDIIEKYASHQNLQKLGIISKI